MNHYDVIIIGTGAGGGTLLHELAATGKQILVLERGGNPTLTIIANFLRVGAHLRKRLGAANAGGSRPESRAEAAGLSGSRTPQLVLA